MMPSTVIRHIAYDEVKKDLMIEFVSGLKYIYHGVPADVYVRFKAAGSKGVYFNRHIKDCYDYEKIEELPGLF